jgi:hypothetical protein
MTLKIYCSVRLGEQDTRNFNHLWITSKRKEGWEVGRCKDRRRRMRKLYIGGDGRVESGRVGK